MTFRPGRPARPVRSRTLRRLLAPATSALVVAGLLASVASPAEAVTRSTRILAAGALDGDTTPSASVSGMRMPGELRGYQQVFADDFAGNTLDSTNWSRYEGRPKGTDNSVWRRSNTLVENGKLVLRTTKEDGSWYSGGTSNARSGSMTYGKWVVRFRAQKAAGVGYVFLLYPQGGGWPPEIDFAEDSGGDRDEVMATSHWSPENKQAHSWLQNDFSRWHTLGVVITPEKVEYTLDGKVWATHTGDAVPHQPMWLGLQTQHSNCKPAYVGSCDDATTPQQTDVEVDWVVRYAPK